MGTKNSWQMIMKRFFLTGLCSLCCLSGFMTKADAQDIQQDIQEIRMLFDLGQRAYEEKRFEDAIRYFERIITQNNSFAGAYYALGLVYQEISQDPHYPLWYFQTAIKIDPEFVPAYEMLCRSYYQLEEYTEAESVCLTALKLNPDLVSAQLSLAWVYLMGRSDADLAVHYFEKVIQKVNTPFIHFGLGIAYAMRGEHGKVLEIVTDLRSQGMEEFAAYLEALVRSKTSPEKFLPAWAVEEPQTPVQDGVAAPSPDAGQEGRGIVPIPVPVVVTPSIMENAEVQIKGKIQQPEIGLTGSVEPVTYGGQKGPHPGGLSK